MRKLGPNVPTGLAATFAVFAVVALGLSLAFRSADQTRLEQGRHDNCVAIEEIKAEIRPPVFNLADTKAVLRDLNVDPASERGERLIARIRETAKVDRATFAPGKC